MSVTLNRTRLRRQIIADNKAAEQKRRNLVNLAEWKNANATDAAARFAAEHGLRPSALTGTGDEGKITIEDVRKALGA